MKNPLPSLGRLVTAGCFLALLPSSIRAEPPVFEFLPPDDPALAEVRRLGERTVDQAGSALLVEVKRVLADTAPALAVAKLHLKEYQLPPAQGRLAITAIRRTSLRIRNEANAPDEADLAALAKIQRQIEGGDPVPKLLLQKLTRPGQPVEWRVYRPLGTPAQCLACHGSADELAAGVPETLKTFYPQDKAVDYKLGSWRGVLRVSITEAAAKK